MKTKKIMNQKVTTAVMNHATDKQRLVLENVKLAQSICDKYQGKAKMLGLSIEDLEQEAYVGLTIAANRYDASMNVPFGKYAFNFCLHEISVALKMEYKNLTEEEDANYYEEEYTTETLEQEMIRKQKYADALEKLNSKERLVFCYHEGYGAKKMNFKEIAKKMHMQPNRVVDIYANGVRKIEESAKAFRKR